MSGYGHQHPDPVVAVDWLTDAIAPSVLPSPYQRAEP